MLMLVMNAKFVSAASYRATKVVDGDTISVRMGKNDALVRLIGVDAPELSSRSNTKKGCFAVNRYSYTLLESVAHATWRGLWNPWTCPVNR